MHERDMDYLLGAAQLWKGKYKIDWCNLCESIILIHGNCPGHGTTCNGGGCPECHDDFVEFHTLKMEPFWYLTDEERAVVQKHNYLRDLLFKCLDAGKTTLDWQWLLWEGHLSVALEEIFAEQIKGLDRNPKWDKVG